MKYVKLFEEFASLTEEVVIISQRVTEISEALTFADADAYKAYAAKHKVRPTTEVIIGGKKVKAGEVDKAEGSEEKASGKIAIEMDTLDPNMPEFKKALGKMGISMEVVDQSGPGGGAPVVRYVGSEAAIEKMLQKFWEAEPGEYADYYEEA